MIGLSNLKLIGLSLLAGAFLLLAVLWQAHEAGKQSAIGQQAEETIDEIRKAKDAADSARLRELAPDWVPDDKWRRE